MFAGLKAFVCLAKETPAILQLPQLQFFSKYIEELGGKIPAVPAASTGEGKAAKPKPSPVDEFAEREAAKFAHTAEKPAASASSAAASASASTASSSSASKPQADKMETEEDEDKPFEWKDEEEEKPSEEKEDADVVEADVVRHV